VFDCRLHGCSQGLVLPSEKQSPWSNPEENNKTPCGIHCYLLELKDKENINGAKFSTSGACEAIPVLGTTKDILSMEFSPKEGSVANSSCTGVKKPRAVMTEGACSGEEVTAESNRGGSNAGKESSVFQHAEFPRRGKRRLKRGGISRKDYKRTAKEVLVSMRKRQKTIVDSDIDTVVSGSTPPDINFSSSTRHSDSSKSKISQKKLFRTISVTKPSRKQDTYNIDDARANDIKEEDEDGDETRSVNDMKLVSVEKQGKRACLQ
ncbi:hypothetical protein KI387_020836, partial [Taxus chinensis]